MKLDALTVELRPRSSWEAMELGTALVRRHARAIWIPWLIVTGTVFALLNLAAWSIGQIWIALVLMWWLRPVFDRIPMYVLSRAVFGSVPGVAETLRAQLHWGWRPMLGHLTWRRFSPMRAAMLPVDLLEGAVPARMAERRRVIGGGLGGPAMLLTLVCLHFLLALQLSLAALVLLFVPNEQLPDFLRSTWQMLEKDTPDWLQLLLHAADWLAVAFLEPFYVGAGFGLYLNRRTQLEAWDLEIVFRRLRRRLERTLGGAAAVLLAFALLAPGSGAAQAIDPADPPAAQAEAPDDAQKDPQKDKGKEPQKGAAADAPRDTPRNAPKRAHAAKSDAAVNDEDEEEVPQLETRTLPQIFGEGAVDPAAFEKAGAEAYRDPDLRPKREAGAWKPRNPEKEEPEEANRTDPAFFRAISNAIGFMVENALWLLVGALVVVLALTARKWLPWLRGIAAMPEPEPPAPVSLSLEHAEPLPPDIATVARRLWAEGQPRRALALLYRASVEAMVARIGAHPPPGATEADCLRLSRRLPEAEDRTAFQSAVKVWQYAAYAHTLPAAADFESLVTQLAQRFGWRA
jgi:hypothetical protein